jgi:hypothetical protein
MDRHEFSKQKPSRDDAGEGGEESRLYKLRHALRLQEGAIKLVDMRNMLGQPADDEGGCFSGDLGLSRMEFYLQIEAGCDQLVVFRLVLRHGGITVFDEIGFFGCEVLRDTGDQSDELFADRSSIAASYGVAERIDQSENFPVLFIMCGDVGRKLLLRSM